MRIAFDAYWWSRGPTSNAFVMRSLVMAWAEVFPHDHITLFVRTQADVAAAQSVRGVDRAVRLHVYPHGAAILGELPKRRDARRADAVLTQNFRPSLAHATPFVHDLLFVEHPEWFTTIERAYFRAISNGLRKATLVLTSSASEARRIEQTYPTSRVVPIGLGIDEALLTIEQSPQPGLTPQSFLLTVARLNVRKNLAPVVDALLSTDLLTPTQPLVVVGGESGRMNYKLPTTDPRFILLNYVSTARLAWLYRNASGFLYPSLGEGFGLPPVEALALGCPVAANDIPVFRETLGDNALFFDASSQSAIVEAADRLLARSSVRPRTAWAAAAVERNRRVWRDTAGAARSAIEAAIGQLK